jgi:hypothetical protein
MGGAVISREIASSFDDQFEFVNRSLLTFEGTKYDDKSDRFEIRIYLNGKGPNTSTVATKTSYEISVLHCKSGKVSKSIYLDYDRVNEIYEKIVLVAAQGSTISSTLAESFVGKVESRHFNHLSSVEELVFSCLEIVSSSLHDSRDNGHEILLNMMISEAELGAPKNCKYNRLLSHSDTLEISGSVGLSSRHLTVSSKLPRSWISNA